MRVSEYMSTCTVVHETLMSSLKNSPGVLTGKLNHVHVQCKMYNVHVKYVIHSFRIKFSPISKTVVLSDEFNSICPMNVNSNKKTLCRKSFFP